MTAACAGQYATARPLSRDKGFVSSRMLDEKKLVRERWQECVSVKSEDAPPQLEFGWSR